VFRVADRNLILSLMLLLLAACGGSDSSSNNVALRTIGVTPASSSQQLGKTLQLVATGTYSDGTTRDVSSTATWMSSKTSVAAISAAGLVSTVSIGAVTITATLDGVAGQAIMTVTPGPAIESTLYTFGTAAPILEDPNSPLLQASDGDFYGTTATGGANGNGTVYKITAAGIETVLYSFGASPADATNPYGSLIQATDGNFYGTTSEGGAQRVCGVGLCGAVYKITPAGVETVLHSFTDAPYGASPSHAYGPRGGMIQASDGNFYGTAGGGANRCNSDIGRLVGCGSVYMITPAGVETVIYSFGASASDGTSPVGALIQASDGNFYGTTSAGGANGFGTVFKVTPAGIETVLHSFGASPSDGRNLFPPPFESLIQASDGNFYGMTPGGGANTCPAGSPLTNSCGTVFEITPAGVETILYSFGASASDGSNPEGNLVQASDGNFYGVTEGGGSQKSGTVFKLIP
jgi:uncharacterized repeat protein (TIGR03803 family)